MLYADACGNSYIVEGSNSLTSSYGSPFLMPPLCVCLCVCVGLCVSRPGAGMTKSDPAVAPGTPL